MSDHIIKDPNSILDYVWDWSDWLDGDTISSSSWTVASGLTQTASSNTTTTATTWLSGGTEGQVYAVTNRIVTAAGRTEDWTRNFKIRSK